MLASVLDARLGMGINGVRESDHLVALGPALVMSQRELPSKGEFLFD